MTLRVKHFVLRVKQVALRVKHLTLRVKTFDFTRKTVIYDTNGLPYECPEYDCRYSTLINFMGQVLDEVKDSKYLEVTISNNLDWSKHITTTTTKANAKMSFIKRNLKNSPQKLKEIAHFSLVRSFVDYASAVWDPHQKFNQEKLEMVQRRAARFVKSRYRRTDGVTAMLDELGWPCLSK